MLTYLLRRLILMVPTLLGVLAVVFFTMAAAPGGFTGVRLSAEGVQTQGDEARRIQQYFNRRYGADQPAYVQFGRWLNLVSPIGFEMATDQKRDISQRSAVEPLIRQRLPDAPDRRVQTLTDTVIDLSSYSGEDLERVTEQLLDAPPDAASATRLFDWLDAEQDDAFFASLDEMVSSDPSFARDRLISRVSFETTGRDRVLFSQPTLKMPSLGESRRGRPVLDLVFEALPVTLLLNAITIPLIYLIAVPTGVLAAHRRGSLFDTTSGGLFIALWSFPVIFAGVLAISYLANVQHLRWFPTGGLHDIRADRMPMLPMTLADGTWTRGWLLDMCWHLVLPVVCLTYTGFAALSKIARGAVLDNLYQDYARTARAKGVPEHDVLWRHVMRNSMLPLITVFAGILPGLIGGSVVVETIFSLQGMGKLGVDAAFQKDRELLMGTTLIVSLLGLFALLLRDVFYAIADPRVSYE